MSIDTNPRKYRLEAQSRLLGLLATLCSNPMDLLELIRGKLVSTCFDKIGSPPQVTQALLMPVEVAKDHPNFVRLILAYIQYHTSTRAMLVYASHADVWDVDNALKYCCISSSCIANARAAMTVDIRALLERVPDANLGKEESIRLWSLGKRIPRTKVIENAMAFLEAQDDQEWYDKARIIRASVKILQSQIKIDDNQDNVFAPEPEQEQEQEPEPEEAAFLAKVDEIIPDQVPEETVPQALQDKCYASVPAIPAQHLPEVHNLEEYLQLEVCRQLGKARLALAEYVKQVTKLNKAIVECPRVATDVDVRKNTREVLERSLNAIHGMYRSGAYAAHILHEEAFNAIHRAQDNA